MNFTKSHIYLTHEELFNLPVIFLYRDKNNFGHFALQLPNAPENGTGYIYVTKCECMNFNFSARKFTSVSSAINCSAFYIYADGYKRSLHLKLLDADKCYIDTLMAIDLYNHCIEATNMVGNVI